MDRSGIERENGQRRLGCTSLCHRGGSSQGGRCRGGVSDSDILWLIDAISFLNTRQSIYSKHNKKRLTSLSKYLSIACILII